MIEFDVQVESSAGTLRNEADAIQAAIDRGVARWAEALPHLITRRLRAGTRADGQGSQPRNARSTLEAKQRKGQGSTPGVATGLLSARTRWRVERTQDGGWEVQPPRDRKDVPGYLEQQGYEFVSISEADHDLLDRYIQDELDKIGGGR